MLIVLCSHIHCASFGNVVINLIAVRRSLLCDTRMLFICIQGVNCEDSYTYINKISTIIDTRLVIIRTKGFKDKKYTAL